MQRAAAAGVLPRGDAAVRAATGSVAAAAVVMAGPFVVDAGAGSGGVRLHAPANAAAETSASTRDTEPTLMRPNLAQALARRAEK